MKRKLEIPEMWLYRKMCAWVGAVGHVTDPLDVDSWTRKSWSPTSDGFTPGRLIGSNGFPHLQLSLIQLETMFIIK